MQITYFCLLSTQNSATTTFNTITNSTPDIINKDISKLSLDNYPTGQNPSRDKNGYLLPNSTNQAIFKNQPLSWWITNLNNNSIQYRPVSNTVNWAFVNSDSKDIHILYDITKIIIPNKTKTVSTNKETRVTSTTYEDNNCILMISAINNLFGLSNI